MKKWIFIVSLLLLHSSAVSQLSLIPQEVRDSLWAVWENESMPKVDRAEALRWIMWGGLMDSDTDSAMVLARLEYDFAKEHGLKQQIASALNTMGSLYGQKSQFKKALEVYKEGLAIQYEIQNPGGIGAMTGNIADIYVKQGKIMEAINLYEVSSNVYKKMDDPSGVSISFGRIGTLYSEVLHDYNMALRKYRQGLRIAREHNFKSVEPEILNQMGMTYTFRGDYDSAGYVLFQGLNLAEELGSEYYRAAIFSSIGTNYRLMGEIETSLIYNLDAYRMVKQKGDKHLLGLISTEIGAAYNTLGNFSKAREYCEKAYKTGHELGAIAVLKYACQCLYNTAKAEGNVSQALKYFEELTQVEQDIQREESSRKVQQMEFARQVLADSLANVEKERMVQEAHNMEVLKEKQNRNIAMTAGFLFLVLSGGFYSRWRYVRKSRAEISKEKDRSENLLLNILPAEIAEELKEKGRADARDFEMVSILFTDFKSFTETSARLSAADLVAEINTCFEAFDGIMVKYGIEKIKTIGDAYMAAGGLPVPKDDSGKNTVLAGLEMQDFISKRKIENETAGKPAFEMRVGIHTGPVVAGIVGVKKFQYDIWGDTVNTASRMESSGVVGKVNISQSTYELLKDTSTSLGGSPDFVFESRGKIEAKGKGEVEMWFVGVK